MNSRYLQSRNILQSSNMSSCITLCNYWSCSFHSLNWEVTILGFSTSFLQTARKITCWNQNLVNMTLGPIYRTTILTAHKSYMACQENTSRLSLFRLHCNSFYRDASHSWMIIFSAAGNQGIKWVKGLDISIMTLRGYSGKLEKSCHRIPDPYQWYRMIQSNGGIFLSLRQSLNLGNLT